MLSAVLIINDKIKKMREIKFRGKTENGEWFFGDLLHIKGGLSHPEKVAILIEMNKHGGGEKAYAIPNTIGQFTGMKDCDGKEIFEGDIIGDWNDCDGKMVLSNEVVYFDETLGCWMLDQSLHKDHSFASSLFEELNDFTYKVIGNIHDNPELLSGS